MALIDESFFKYPNFQGYTGDAPSTEAEYDEMKAKAFSGTPPTWSDVQAKMYDVQRKAEYPDIGTQLDYIYHNGIDKWKAEVVDPVKKKYPKPS